MNKIVTETDNPDPQKHRFVGMFRPPFEQCTGQGKAEVVVSRSNSSYWTTGELFQAWHRGEFDFALYEEI